MDVTAIFLRLGLALGLGLLVGLQRERVEKPLAGIRTFALFTLLGAISALLAASAGGWVIAAGLLAVAALLYAGNQTQTHTGRPRTGLTTEAAVLLMYGVGAYLVLGEPAVAIAVAGATALLLYFKEPLHTLVHRIGDRDIKAIMQFVLISLVILPVLPNENYGPGRFTLGDSAYGPYDVLNPFKIWLLVVLIVALSLCGYVAYKFVSARAGSILGGLLGGLISSTATTVSYARLARQSPVASGSAALAIVIASAVVFGRVIVLVAVAAPAFLGEVAGPVLAMLAVLALAALAIFLMVGRDAPVVPEQTNPSELRSALMFGALFAAVLLAVAVARDVLGSAGLYAVAGLSGLTDMDAITLSTAQMTRREQAPLDGRTAWRLILVAAMANLVFKAGIVAAMANLRLLAWVGGAFAAAFMAGTAILLWWPVG